VSEPVIEEDLLEALHRNEVRAMVENAELTRDAVGSPVRTEAARRQVRMAMYKFAFGQITELEKKRILDVLRPCCPDVFVVSYLPPEAGSPEFDSEP
jgi:hypothetical protein